MNEIEKVLGRALRVLVKELQEELKRQGHVLTGNLLKSIRESVYKEGRRTIGEVLLRDYAKYVNNGVEARNIPFGGGRGSRSKYIEGLINFWQKRGISDIKEATRAAFATAHKHKKEGMPTKASRRFSQTGKRTGFIETAIETKRFDFRETLSQGLARAVNVTITNTFKNTELRYIA